jgi:hypothetical protein
MAGSAATPLFNVTVPNTVVPSRNCTLPVAEAGETFAVKATACPMVEGFTDELMVVIDAVLVTVCVNTGDVLPTFVASPP